MNIVLLSLLFSVFIMAFAVVLLYECRIRLMCKEPNKNKVHFYVARDKNGTLWLHLGKLFRDEDDFKGVMCLHSNCFEECNLDKNDYANLKWEDGPVEVFINMED